MSSIDATVIGCSAGGLPALQQILRPLPPDTGMAIIIVSHVPSGSTSLLPQLLARDCRMPVHEAEERAVVQAGHVYVAPPSYHLLIEPDFTFALSVDAPVCNVRPAIDVLFASAANAYRQRLVGVVLTGANVDGARGLQAVAAAGGVCLVQTPETAEAEAMPRAAIAAVASARVLSLSAIAQALIELSLR